jgi:hypothetical protein
VLIHPIRILAALALIVGIAGSVAACHYRAVTPTIASQNAKTDVQVDPKPLLLTERTRRFDETPITPMETVGAQAQIETNGDQIDQKSSLLTEGTRPLDETAITPMETVGAPAQL